MAAVPVLSSYRSYRLVLYKVGCVRYTQSSVVQRRFTMKLLGSVLLLIGMGSAAFAITRVPEISPTSAGSAIALISGAVLVMRGRRKK